MTDSHFVTPSDQIEIHVPDGRTLRGSRGATAASLLQPITAELPAPLVGVVVNGELHELTYPIEMEASIRPVTMADADGARIYRRSLTFLLEAAFIRRFPETRLYIDHSLASGGYYCEVRGREPLTPTELEALAAEMRSLVAQNLAFDGRQATAPAGFAAGHDDYSSIMAKALGDRLAEALAELMHKKARDLCGFGRTENLTMAEILREKYRGIRPAPGYPACPDHTEKGALFDLLGAQDATGISLTENFAMHPASSVSGFYFNHPDAKYFAVGKLGRDQVADYAARKGADPRQTEKWLAPYLDYEP